MLDKLKDANIISSFRSKIAQRAVFICDAQTPSTHQKWVELKSAYHEVTRECLGRQPKGFRPWISIKTREVIEVRAKLKLSLHDALTQHRPIELVALYREKQKEVKNEFYPICLTGNALVAEHPVKNVNGPHIHGDYDQIARWRDHFLTILNHVLDRDVSMTSNKLS